MSTQHAQRFMQKNNLQLPDVVLTPTTGLPSLQLNAFPTVTESANIAVNPNDDFPLSDALEKAADGATITVPEGEYEETLNISKSVRFVARGKVVLFSESGDAPVVLSGGNVTFEGFIITQRRARARGLVTVNGGNLRLINCRLSSLANATIAARGNSVLDVNQCVIKGKNGAAIILSGDSHLNAERTIFSYARVSTVQVKAHSAAKFKQCIFLNNPQSGLSVSDDAQVFVDSCNFTECLVEIKSNGACNVIKGTTFSKTGGSSGVIVSQDSNVYLYSCKVLGCCIDLRGNSTSKLQGNSYQGGSFLASNNATAELENESFVGDTPAAIGVHESAQATLSNVKLSDLTGIGFVIYESGKCYVNKGSISNVKLQGVVCHSGGEFEFTDVEIRNVDEDVILVQDGVLSLTNTSIRDAKKNALSIVDATSCKIKNSNITNNKLCGILALRSTIDIENSTFANNGFSAIHSVESTIQIDKSTINQNQKGGITAIQNSKVKLDECKITNNQWAGFMSQDTSKIKATKSTLTGNQLGATCHGKITLDKCEITQHRENALQSFGKLKLKECVVDGNGLAVATAGSGKAVIKSSTFNNNNICVEITQDSTVDCEDSTFKGTTGNYALGVTGHGFVSCKKCTVSSSRRDAFYVDGKIELENSTIERTSRIGLLASENSSGNVKNNKFDGIGECGVHIGGGKTVVQSNTISNFAQFGVYIKPNSQAYVEENQYSSNRLANIWKE